MPQGAPYKVRIQCTNCREPSDKASFIDPAVEEAVPGGRGVANLVQRCKFCSRNSNVKFVSGSAKPYTGYGAQLAAARFFAASHSRQSGFPPAQRRRGAGEGR